jgi:hypothetical protein
MGSADNLIWVDYFGLVKIVESVGFSSTIRDSFANSNAARDAGWDGNNLYTISSGSGGKCRKHAGFSSTIVDSFANPSTSGRGCEWAEPNLLSCNSGGTIDKIYKHQGFSSTILDSFDPGFNYPGGLGWDGTNVMTGDYVTDKYYLFSGFSSSISDSFEHHAANYPSAGGYDFKTSGGALLSSDTNPDKIWQHDGFSSTILDSFTPPSGANAVYGTTWMGNYVSYRIAVVT